MSRFGDLVGGKKAAPAPAPAPEPVVEVTPEPVVEEVVEPVVEEAPAPVVEEPQPYKSERKTLRRRSSKKQQDTLRTVHWGSQRPPFLCIITSVKTNDLMTISADYIRTSLQAVYGESVTAADIRAWCAMNGTNYQTVTN